MLNVAMFGASGRMGRTIVPLVAESSDLRLSGALVAAADPSIGHDAGVVAGVAPLAISITSDPERALDGAQVVIDFTLPAATPDHARRCLAHSVPMVIGTTGHDDLALGELRKVAERLPIVMAPNMSLGVNLLFKLAELAARALDAGYDAEIVEAHHRHKVDAPSGTALGLGRAVAQGRGTSLDAAAVYARQGATGPRPTGAIGFSVVRGGDIVGDHRVIFAGPGEQIELAHHAQDRSGFARGALVAARWVVGRPPGLYSMLDVLGL
ncbi:MAG TPA: 4-hydroxy-tetrahydrodipicolinate reductase [Steroidobacteraceae bacterium]|jgi:4-hydroxy-tetrahydrodipicolinate reductase|nr:4-hydroxy-tetrahydrodipicolinate reductase [Steroidobacteraceae bacterium]